MLVMSQLARKVYEQTLIPNDLSWAWWVELRLQEVKINGLVKMINGSKKNDQKYIDGYINKYKWAFRENILNISDKAWFFSAVQFLEQDFSWNLWSKIVQIPIEHIDIIMESINIGISYNKPFLPYILAIYESKIHEQNLLVETQKEAIDNQVDMSFKKVIRTEAVKLKWDCIKGLV
jgi:hypothetical protein